MKTFDTAALLLALLLATFQAKAIIITDVEEINQRIGGLIDTGNGLSINTHRAKWVHDLSDTAFSLGTATSATLSIELSDDPSDVLFPFEYAAIIIGIIDFQDGQPFYQPVTDWSGSLGLNSLAALNSTGQLNVEVWSLLGDFIIGNSTLEITAIPEPGSLLMLATTLGALGVLRRRKFSK
jgi:hypothetical protein